MIYTLDELPEHAGELAPDGTLVLCCIAFDATEFDPERRALHDEAVALAAQEGHCIGVYPGSTVDYCLGCNVRVGVGPKQQKVLEAATNHQVPYSVFCMPCGLVVHRLHGSDDGEAPVVINLGNTYARRSQ